MNEQSLNADSQVEGDVKPSSNAGYPSVTFKSLTFSDGTTISLDPDDVVVLVGPNNAGKSVTLRELEGAFARNLKQMVLQSCETRILGTKEEFQEFVRKHARIRSVGATWAFSGYQWSLSIKSQDVQEFWPEQISTFRSMFCLKMPTETRITGSDPPNAVNTRDEPLNHPIHLLLDDDALELKISEYFRRAFNDDLILDRNPSRTIALLVGPRPTPHLESGEDRLSKAFRDRVSASTTPLVQQGDGMRSFTSVILHLLAPITASVLLLDEPEAFLHPPQARFLGEIIATEKSSRAQLFVATHSPDVLQGLVNVASDQIRVLRMQRDGSINRVKELDKELVKKISSDPLMNYSSVMSGVFHQRVIICESDSDCMFYSSILDLDEIHGEGHPDVLFVHAGGKDRMPTLTETLRALDVPVDVVADIDILRDESKLRLLVNALEGDWSGVEQLAKAVRTAVENSTPRLSIDQIKQEVQAALSKELPDSEPERHLHSNIKGVFRSISPWDAVKHYGESAIPKGQATQQFRDLQQLLQEMGLWVVPVGEMEGFCRSIGGHGPSWARQVISERDLGTDSELEDAREFVRKLWEGRQ